MVSYIILALINGIIISLSRAINANLSTNIGPLKASFCNHIVGFIFLTLLLILIRGFSPLDLNTNTPIINYLGGFFGALFVAVNSYVFSRLGATKTVLLVISGQMLSSVIIDYKSGNILPILAQLSGVLIILLGVYLASISNFHHSKNFLESK